MDCAGIRNCQLVSRRDRGDCREISLTRRRLVAIVAVFVANGAVWYAWMMVWSRKLIRIYAEWMSQRRTVEGQGDEEHNLEDTQSPAPAIPQQPSISPVDNN
jgi:hypothetical protein